LGGKMSNTTSGGPLASNFSKKAMAAGAATVGAGVAAIGAVATYGNVTVENSAVLAIASDVAASTSLAIREASGKAAVWGLGLVRGLATLACQNPYGAVAVAVGVTVVSFGIWYIGKLKAEIGRQKQQIQEQTVQIQNQTLQIREKDTQIQNQDTQIQDQTQQIQEKDTQIQDQDTQIAELRALITKKETEAEATRKKLDKEKLALTELKINHNTTHDNLVRTQEKITHLEAELEKTVQAAEFCKLEFENRLKQLAVSMATITSPLTPKELTALPLH
jgi:hypothetical protein